MTSMETKLRPAKKEDIPALLQIYENFTKQFVGSAERTLKTFQRMIKRKDNIVYVAIDEESQVIGYVYARINKRFDRGEFEEIVVDPKRDFAPVAELLVKKVNRVFVEKHVSTILAGSLRNPEYEKIFPKLGFSEYESLSVFMYSVLNIQKFLNELSPVLVTRLQKHKRWRGTVQLECEGHSIFLEKTERGAQQTVWTNQAVDLKATLSSELLIKLVFGIEDVVKAHQRGQLKTKSANSKDLAEKMLKALFPKSQFLIMDHW